jgi:Uma2 family endonuclease
MQVAIERERRYSIEEYFRLDEASEEKLEYRDGYIVPLGEIIAMAGGSESHALISANFAGELRNALKGKPCRVYSSDLRVRIKGTPLYVYPDVSVICGPTQFDTETPPKSVLNPKVIVEVTSPGTEAYDRTEKFKKYLRLDSVDEYVMVSQNAAWVDVYTRQADGNWLFQPVHGPGAVVRLSSLDVALPLSEIYAGVDFPPEPLPPTV